MSNDAGNIQYEKRSEAMVSLEVINVTEKKRFMDLEKVTFVHNATLQIDPITEGLFAFLKTIKN